MNKYTIGQVAKITGLPTKTLRFYEEKGVIKGAAREENGYRFFTKENIEEIKLIKYAKDLGLPLADIKELMIGCAGGDCKHTKEHNKKIIDKNIDLLTERIRQMKILKKKLQKIQENGPYCCGILHELAISDESEVSNK
jgi:MerR family transcriptional regulator, Zn(II)-responsive regulator of zntA